MWPSDVEYTFMHYRIIPPYGSFENRIVDFYLKIEIDRPFKTWNRNSTTRPENYFVPSPQNIIS